MVSGTRTVFSMRALMLGLILALLATTFGATALMAQSSDATSSALLDPRHPAVDNSSRTVDFTVTSSTNATLLSAVMDLGSKTHGCEVTATAEVDRTVD